MVALAASAHADPDAGFNNQFHGDGIYGRRDYNAGLGKITCERLTETAGNARVPTGPAEP
jgi:hypothetical protein